MLELFSVDDHVVEPADVWSSRVPARFREAAPHVIEEDGREFWVYEDQRSLTMGLNSVAGKPREQWGLEPARFSDMIPGSYDPRERPRDLLANGVLASVNFPSLPGFGGRLFAQFKDKELADACVRAWNDFILDEWVPGGPPGMFVPMVICQLWDPKLAEAEIRRCVDKGAKALCFVENPSADGAAVVLDRLLGPDLGGRRGSRSPGLHARRVQWLHADPVRRLEFPGTDRDRDDRRADGVHQPDAGAAGVQVPASSSSCGPRAASAGSRLRWSGRTASSSGTATGRRPATSSRRRSSAATCGSA